MESIEIDVQNLEPMTTSFGPGIELLMNDKQRSTSTKLGDLDSLERELNNLSGAPSSQNETKSFTSFFGSLGSGFGSNQSAAAAAATSSTNSGVGIATLDSVAASRTADGYTKISMDIPKTVPPLSDRDKRRKKKMMLKKIEEWAEKKYIKNPHFTEDTPYEEIEDEYESAVEDKQRREGIKLGGWWFMTFINSLEYANTVMDEPFGLCLDGWGEQVSESIDEYEDIFSQLHEKYKGGKLAPEVQLLMRMGISAAMISITNKALSSATPGMNEIIRQSPELMKAFTQATAQTLSKNNESFNFVNQMVQGPSNPDSVNTSFGPPPAPVDPKLPPPSMRTMNYTRLPLNSASRPDLQLPDTAAAAAASDGGRPMFREQGISVNNSYGEIQERSVRPVAAMTQFNAPPQPAVPPPIVDRPEMNVPETPPELENMLLKLKRKPVPSVLGGTGLDNAQEIDARSNYSEDLSVTSVQSTAAVLKLKSGKRGPRKPKSERNVMSLDI